MHSLIGARIAQESLSPNARLNSRSNRLSPIGDERGVAGVGVLIT